ncbi:Protein CBG01945 [Caenorhabditis briggsae]|uniref:Uncharacterized protein n=2 Tax=Caenorhabditis briggsae TaxID=6238 RepID=A0AAE8ZPI6_CAEBR|nr:Protein CBG01945 [Caenorhabditis briggsae]ULT80441.1 hypothetical protein L3Y34_010779 [Caenorhabditis briggsae]CAP23137.1 Protein CBG01945 [Caenorhabditis briggsae]
MWAHHLVIPLLLLITTGQCNIDKSPAMLSHYMNLLSFGESWLAATFDMSSNGTFFIAQNSERRLEIGFRNKTLYMVLPISKSKIETRNWMKRYVIDFDSVGKIGPILDLIVTFQHNHIHVYDACDEIFAGFEPHLELSLVHAKTKIVENWEGAQPIDFGIGSGWPIGQKCRQGGAKKKYADSYSEEIEKSSQHTTFKDSDEIFFEQIVVSPPGFDGCKVNNELLMINETKILDCNICTCLSRDDVVCRAIDCPAVTCKNPMIKKGGCCPVCGEQCFYENHKIANAHGEVFWPGDCYRCQCWDTKVECSSEYATCEPPGCPDEDWVYNEKFNCCPRCRDFARFCAVNPCHKDASCTDSKRGPKCSCNTGFQGNGTYCEDIDECAFSQDAREQLGGCLAGSICRNIPGSFKCDCMPGYQMIGEHTCLPLIRV